MLISQTHLTSLNFVKIYNYSIYNSNHPNGTSHGGTAIIVKSVIKNHCKETVNEVYLPATAIVKYRITTLLLLQSICPPRHKFTSKEFNTFSKLLGQDF